MVHRILVSLGIVFALAWQARCQETATLTGQVTDASGAVVQGASVVARGPQGFERTAATDAEGRYTLLGLPAGTYTVSASSDDLASPRPMRVAIKTGVVHLNLQLDVRELHENVTVDENAGPAVNTESASNASGLTMSGSDLDSLSDDPDDLQADLQALAGPAAGPNGAAIFIDGFQGGNLPPKNAIREIRINQNPFSPQYDKLGYGRIEVFTKPGSGDYHATVDYNLGTDAWNSRNPYSDRKAPFLLNEFEGTATGPINKRASFTLDAQRNMVDNGFVINAVTLDPATLAVTPFAAEFRTPQSFTRVSPRVDWQLSRNNTLTARYDVTRVDIDGAGIGGFELASRGYRSRFTMQTAQASDTAVLGTGTVNETRFQFFRSAGQKTAISLAPEIQVLDAFNGGGSQLGRNSDTLSTFEFQNYTSILHGAHTVRFGIRLLAQMDDNVQPQNFNGVFTFAGGLAPMLNAANQPVLANGAEVLAPISSVESYRRTLVFQQLGYSPAAIRALGGGATQFSINVGNPALSVHQLEGAAYVGDDWHVRPNVTLSLGLRFEAQSNIHDLRGFAPRFAVAWAPGGAKAQRKTVLRAGSGMFYSRFALANTLAAERYNGVVQKQYVIADPDFFPAVPSADVLASSQSRQVIERVSPSLRAPYILQSAVGLERQLSSKTTLALTYTNAHGLHLLRSEDINAPLPGSGVFPLGAPGPVFVMSSSGLYNQNQLIANVNTRLAKGVSMFAFYAINRAMSNTDGVGTFAANPYDYSGEYGPAATDVRHRLTVAGSFSLRWNISLSPFVILQSGAPFNITAGGDLYGTTLFNGRPGIATDPSKPGLIATAYGLLDPNPTPNEALLARNAGRGPGLATVNLRLTRAFGFGAVKGSSAAAAASVATGKGTAAPEPAGAMPTNRGLHALLGSASSEHRFNLVIGMSARNLLNHTNPGPIVGNITSPLFGLSNQTNVAPNGEGFSESANNRRLELKIRFTF